MNKLLLIIITGLEYLPTINILTLEDAKLDKIIFILIKTYYCTVQDRNEIFHYLCSQNAILSWMFSVKFNKFKERIVSHDVGIQHKKSLWVTHGDLIPEVIYSSCSTKWLEFL